MHTCLESLCQGHSLPQNDARSLFEKIVSGSLDANFIAALLIAMKIKGETPDEITGAALALRKAARHFPRPSGQIADIVGTGGDGACTINISSTSVFVAAAAGIKVCKHGNRSVSSQSGSADVLAELGVNIEMNTEQALKALDVSNACFIFAQQYHPGVRHAAGVRKTLKTRTIFNILGPLINPAQPDVMLVGVYSPDLLLPVANVLPALGVTRAMVVYGSGMDEICLHGPTQVVEIDHGHISEYHLVPEQLGLKSAPLKELRGGNPETNARISLDILSGNGAEPCEHAVAANAGSLIYLAGVEKTHSEGVARALKIIQSGAAMTALHTLGKISHE